MAFDVLAKFHELRYAVNPVTAEATVLSEQGEDHTTPLPPRSVLCIDGTNVWRAKTPEESRRNGMAPVTSVREVLAAEMATPVMGYRVSQKLNKGYIYRTEARVAEHPDSYYDETAANFVNRYFAPLLSKGGHRRGVADIAGDMRISLVVHSYNEFTIMVENALRDRLAHEGFNSTEQQQIMSQIFSLELGCNHHAHRTDTGISGFNHMQVIGVNDERVDRIEQAVARVGEGQRLWGSPQFVDEGRSAGAQLGPNRVAVLVKTPEFTLRNGQRVENHKGHNIDGYLAALPPRAREIALEMLRAEKLPERMELAQQQAAPGDQWRRNLESRQNTTISNSPTVG